MSAPLVSVLMPTFGHAHFIAGAIESLMAQSFEHWELVIVDDGSPDDTSDVVLPYLEDPRIAYHRSERNGGLGAALNQALELSTGSLVSYLPSDDLYHRDHLAQMVKLLAAYPAAKLAHTGVRHHYNRSADGRIAGESLQLVQVMHRRRADRWVERSELTTDDLHKMYWNKLLGGSEPVGTGQVSCEWVDHPHQRHKIVREPEGGINAYRTRYEVREPLIFHTTTGHRIDEATRYRHYREQPIEASPDGLKILIVGELAYNPERVLALAEQGHRLYGLWTDTPYWYNWVGPLPFGHVEDIPRTGWQAAVRALKPDVIYALLNWQTVPFAHHVMTENPGVPFVWHFKEGPFICLEKGSWKELVELYAKADGRIYSSVEMQNWFEETVPQVRTGAPSMVLDGDLPKREGVSGERSPLLSAADGEIHTVVAGRPIGLHPETVQALAAQQIHLHFYGEFTHGQWKGWVERAKGMCGRFLHLHPNVDQENWVAEFSKYDAGWLHFFKSLNHNELRRANWDDLNVPARMATLAAAGLPMLQRSNDGHIVAIQTLAKERGLGLFFDDMEELGAQLKDGARMAQIRERVWEDRDFFTFDHHVDALTGFFRRVIERTAETNAQLPTELQSSSSVMTSSASTSSSASSFNSRSSSSLIRSS